MPHILLNVFFLSKQDFHEEYATEAFRQFDKDGSGFISALDFQDIMISIKSHLLTPQVKENLLAVSIMQFIYISNVLNDNV